MDIFSHGLWAGAILGRKKKKKFFVVALISMLPDLFSIGIFWLCVLFGISSMPTWSNWHLDYSSLPSYIDPLYNMSHSLWVFFLVYLLVWIIKARPCQPLLAWGLHILIDIPSHSIFHFPTPFLWPLSNYRYDGISWVENIFLIPDIVILLTVYLGYFLYVKYKARQERRLIGQYAEQEDSE